MSDRKAKSASKRLKLVVYVADNMFVQIFYPTLIAREAHTVHSTSPLRHHYVGGRMVGTQAPALAWGMSWHTAAFVAALLGSLGWMALLISPLFLLILVALLLFVAALASHWMKTIEVAIERHMRLAAPADAAAGSSSPDDGARALVEGAAFQSIATSYVISAAFLGVSYLPIVWSTRTALHTVQTSSRVALMTSSAQCVSMHSTADPLA